VAGAPTAEDTGSAWPHEGFTSQHRVIGRAAAWATFVLLVVYAITTALGFLSLESADDPIGDPYFTMMELLIVLMMPPMVVTMVAVLAYASREDKAYGLTALVLMVVVAAITSGLHAVILVVGDELDATGEAWVPLVTSFEWPSVVYALDILAWDWFFALSMLAAAQVFRAGGLEGRLRVVMIASGVLSLVGLIGVPLDDMQYRNIGIVGYAMVGMAVFLLLGIVFGRARRPEDVPMPTPST
jgi:hypothetical protein